jgi:hypothetical protein
MPFDGKVSDYFETKPAPVYDRDNPPPTMAEAIRMAVADVEAQEAVGVQYEWADCARCTGGAVVRRMGGRPSGAAWFDFGDRWYGVLQCLSAVSLKWENASMRDSVFRKGSDRDRLWADAGFGVIPDIQISITPYETNPTAFKRDMLALADRLEGEGA